MAMDSQKRGKKIAAKYKKHVRKKKKMTPEAYKVGHNIGKRATTDKIGSYNEKEIAVVYSEGFWPGHRKRTYFSTRSDVKRSRKKSSTSSPEPGGSKFRDIDSSEDEHEECNGGIKRAVRKKRPIKKRDSIIQRAPRVHRESYLNAGAIMQLMYSDSSGSPSRKAKEDREGSPSRKTDEHTANIDNSGENITNTNDSSGGNTRDETPMTTKLSYQKMEDEGSNKCSSTYSHSKEDADIDVHVYDYPSDESDCEISFRRFSASGKSIGLQSPLKRQLCLSFDSVPVYDMFKDHVPSDPKKAKYLDEPTVPDIICETIGIPLTKNITSDRDVVTDEPANPSKTKKKSVNKESCKKTETKVEDTSKENPKKTKKKNEDNESLTKTKKKTENKENPKKGKTKSEDKESSTKTKKKIEGKESLGKAKKSTDRESPNKSTSKIVNRVSREKNETKSEDTESSKKTEKKSEEKDRHKTKKKTEDKERPNKITKKKKVPTATLR